MKNAVDRLKTLAVSLTPDMVKEKIDDVTSILQSIQESLRSSSSAEELFSGFQFKEGSDSKGKNTICAEIKGALNKIRNMFKDAASDVVVLIDSVSNEIDKAAGIDSDNNMDTGSVGDGSELL